MNKFNTEPKKATEQKPGKRGKMRLLNRLTLEEQMLFAKRLGILLQAGVPIVQSLNMIKKQARSRYAQTVLQSLVTGVENGQYLHQGLDKYRDSFGDFAVNIVRVGEISGTLHENLGYLADELKKKKELQRKVVSALIYPLLIVFATLGITVLLITYVFPKILPVLQTLHGQLPFTTRTLIWLSHLLTTKGWLIFLIAIAIVFIYSFLIKKVRLFRLWIDKMILKVPVIGKLFKYYHLANFCRTLSVLLRSDVRIVEASSITASTSTNLAYKDSLNIMSERLLKGEKLSTFLEDNTTLFPDIIGQMVTVGESTGKLTETLVYLAEMFEAEVDELSKNLSVAIEPILMIFMGILVGFIAMSIITPIYSLTQSLSLH